MRRAWALGRNPSRRMASSTRDFLHPFHAHILQGVESYASSLQHHVLFAVLHYSPRTPPEKIDLPPVLQEHGLIDGVILAGTIYPNLLRRIEAIHMPFVDGFY